MNSRILGIIGAVLLLIGLFVPLSRSFAADTATTIDFPASTYFGFLTHGDSNAIIYLVLVLCALALSLTKFNRFLLIPGVLILGFVIYDYYLMKEHMQSLSRFVATSPENAELIAQTGAHAWGWFVLGLGPVLLIIAGLMKRKTATDAPS
jgi:hypothetical protein